MPNLEQRIAQWRAGLASVMPRRDDTIRELEDHLREQIDNLLKQGLSSDAAFESGVERIGDARTIAGEFSRMRPPCQSASQWVRGVYSVMGLLAGTFLYILVASGSYHWLGYLWVMHVFTLTTGYVLVFGTGALGICALVKSWWRPLSASERNGTRRAVFVLTVTSVILVTIGIVLGIVWAAQNLNHPWSWAPAELGALLILGWVGLMLLVQLQRTPVDLFLWQLTVLGNVVLVIGWFSAQAILGSVPMPWLLLIFAISQVALVVIRPPQIDANRFA